jgi:hypothetical protein
MKGFTVYKGKSMIDGSPIVGIVTLNSSNPKTGNMAQLWILSDEYAPVEAVKLGADVSICGNCKHRTGKGGACYVLPFQGPTSVYKAYKRGNYSDNITKGALFLEYKALRLGAYGDPAALPEYVLEFLVKNSRLHTGYTHQWKNKRLRHALKYCQASVDSLSEIEQLRAIDPNAKYFRVTDNDIRTNKEIDCLAETQGLSCIECKLCDGKKQNIVINVHGAKSKRFVSGDMINTVSI